MRTNDEAMAMLSRISETATIRKYAAKTQVVDCEASLWLWLGIDAKHRMDAYFRNRSKALLVGDLGHDVWSCAIGRRGVLAYGRSFAEAVARAVGPTAEGASHGA
jgi:hypothetical protein